VRGGIRTVVTATHDHAHPDRTRDRSPRVRAAGHPVGRRRIR
jgi:hypothetical protein